MKRLIPIILITFLCVGNISYAGISYKDRKHFDDGLARIEVQKSNYKRDKQAQKQRDLQRAKRKREKVIRKNKLLDVGKRNSALALEKRRRDREENRRRVRKGDYYYDEINGGFIRK